MLLSKRERTLKSVYFCTRIAHDCFSRDYKHKKVEHFSRQKNRLCWSIRHAHVSNTDLLKKGKKHANECSESEKNKTKHTFQGFAAAQKI